MRKEFRLAGLAAVGLWLAMGCGVALAETTEVEELEEALSEEFVEVETEWLPDEIETPSVTENGRNYEPDYEPDTVSSVPEPDAWALMIVGLAFLGLCARNRMRRELPARS